MKYFAGPYRKKTKGKPKTKQNTEPHPKLKQNKRLVYPEDMYTQHCKTFCIQTTQ